jgi:hypothetical protein
MSFLKTLGLWLVIGLMTLELYAVAVGAYRLILFAWGWGGD